MREAVINAIVHNDYSYENTPQIEIFDDRIEITSVGGLPYGMTEEEFFNGRSNPRNRELMRVFKDLHLVEHMGSGIKRILEVYGRECFEFSDNFLNITLFKVTGSQVDYRGGQVEDKGGQIGGQVRYKGGQIGGQVGDKGGQIGGQVEGKGGQIGGQVGDKGGQIGGQVENKENQVANITQAQHQVLDLIVENSKISRVQLAKKLKINESAIQKHLEVLKSKQIIERVGKTRGYWKVHRS